MRTFEIGKQYSVRSIGDHNCVWTFIVTARTKSTVTIEDIDNGEVKTCRISKQISEFRGAESVKPFGTYSMCPILSA